MAPDSRRFEKCDGVLWAPTSDGFVLHSLNTGRYVSVSGALAETWKYLDGAHSVSDLHDRLGRSLPHSDLLKAIDELATAGFIVEVQP